MRPLLLLLMTVVLAQAACGDDDEESPDPGAAPPAETQRSEKGGCEDVEAPAPKPDGGARKPKAPLAAGK